MPEERSARRAEDFLHLDYQAPSWEWKRSRRSLLLSFLVHAAVVVVLSVPFAWDFFNEEPELSVVPIRFYELGGEGEGSGGGGGGSQGRKPTAFIPEQSQPEPLQTEAPEPRRAPLAPRPPRLLRADSLKVPDLPSEASAYFDQHFSPDAEDFPGLSPDDWTDYGGVDLEASSGSGGGIGGGEGTGQGPGSGWGVGEGEGGGYGGGKYSPGGYDIEPIPIYEPKPNYPPEAREKLVRGGVILEILVHEDGSTEVLRVLKSLPYGCVEAAIEAAQRWRFKPALKGGKPVAATGIITVEFELSVRNQG